MGHIKIDALRISPKFTSEDWRKLNPENPNDWSLAADILKDRLDGRFLHYAGNCLRSPHSGFVVLSIDSLLLETIQQFRDGVTNGNRLSRQLVTKFLESKRFQPEFNKHARDAYYTDIRCGLLHQAEARRMWLIRRDQPELLRPFPDGDGYIIDVRRFHKCVRQSLSDYLDELQWAQSVELRENLWDKMNQICSVREQRGAVDAKIVGA
jgi:hypothetical protein